jgi:hypothetical protein
MTPVASTEVPEPIVHRDVCSCSPTATTRATTSRRWLPTSIVGSMTGPRRKAAEQTPTAPSKPRQMAYRGPRPWPGVDGRPAGTASRMAPGIVRQTGTASVVDPLSMRCGSSVPATTCRSSAAETIGGSPRDDVPNRAARPLGAFGSGQRPDELRAGQPDEGGVVGPSDPSDVEREPRRPDHHPTPRQRGAAPPLRRPTSTGRRRRSLRHRRGADRVRLLTVGVGRPPSGTAPRSTSPVRTSTRRRRRRQHHLRGGRRPSRRYLLPTRTVRPTPFATCPLDRHQLGRRAGRSGARTLASSMSLALSTNAPGRSGAAWTTAARGAARCLTTNSVLGRSAATSAVNGTPRPKYPIRATRRTTPVVRLDGHQRRRDRESAIEHESLRRRRHRFRGRTPRTSTLPVLLGEGTERRVAARGSVASLPLGRRTSPASQRKLEVPLQLCAHLGTQPDGQNYCIGPSSLREAARRGRAWPGHIASAATLVGRRSRKGTPCDAFETVDESP